MASAPNRIKGTLRTGPQEHWYLETQSALCVPGEDREMTVYASTQNPTETQAIVAEVLGVGKNDVVCEVRRLGGGFGGKETQGNHVSAWAALLAHATKRPVKIHLFRDDDQKITGKRHRYLSHYEVGFDDNGVIRSYIVDLNADAGWATDLSMSILERAMLHAENAYFLPNVRITGSAWKTNLPSNTAFRGFGGPQGIAVMETAIDRIGRQLKIDPLEIRKRNFYKHDTNNTTPYGQLVENNHIDVIYDKLSVSSEYERRRKEVDAFNAENKYVKKGLAFTPVKFGISFTTSFLNQAGALVNIYTDGTILVNHGGVEMGQGLNTKMQQVAAAELGIPASWVKVNATNTSKVPNSSPTAASSGSDLNGMAVKNAVDNIKSRLSDFVITRFNNGLEGELSQKEQLLYADAEITDTAHPDRKIGFKELISLAYVGQVGLGATGFYKTPGVNFDRAAGTGKPFHYFSYGMAVSEIVLDTLTGSHKLLRTDIIHDAGSSLNEGLDIGQVEGAFVQGAGWVTTEEIKWDKLGNQLNHSPDTYKIPTIQDIPADFRVELLQGHPNDNTIRRSKAVGEPPFMLAFSVWLAIKDAIASVGNYCIEPEFGLPATNELILLAIEKIRKQAPVVQ
jgi:xanthine dehydrogenase molybdopterin binding subunit